MKKYLELLRTNDVLKKLSLVQLISYFGAWFSNVAIYTMLLQMGVGAEVLALTAAIHFIPGVIQAPFTGVILDKFKTRTIMFTLLIFELIATVSLLMINNINDITLLYILIFIKMAAASFYFTAEMSLLPKFLKENELKLANEIHSIIWSVSYTLGMAISGFIVYVVGVKIAIILDTSTFLLSLSILTTIVFPDLLQKSSGSFFKMMSSTFKYFKKKPLVIHLLIIHSLVGFTAFDAFIALLVGEYYSGFMAISLAIGMMHASRAIGLAIGPVLFARYINTTTLVFLFFYQALAIFIWSLFLENFYISLILSIFVGLSTTILWSYTYTLIQKNTDEEYYGRVVSYNDMLFLSVSAFSSMLIGYAFTSNYSLEQIAQILALIFVAGGFYYLIIKQRFSL